MIIWSRDFRSGLKELRKNAVYFSYNEIMSEAQDKIADAEKELADGRKEADKELADASKKLSDG